MTDENPMVFMPDDVGRFYDQLTLAAREQGTFAENIHVGYWDTADSTEPLPAAVDRLTDLMAERLGLGKDDQLLDVGCGLGGPAMRIARTTGVQVTGITVSREQFAAATALAAEAGLADRVSFRVHDAMDLDFASESFDAAIAIESIIHMPDREHVLRNICRTLRPGGRLVLTDIFVRAPAGHQRHPAIQKFERNMMVTMADIDDYVAMLHRAGLRFRELRDITDNSMQQTFRTLARPVAPGGQAEFLGQQSDPDVFNPAELVGVDEFGCLLAVAERP